MHRPPVDLGFATLAALSLCAACGGSAGKSTTAGGGGAGASSSSSSGPSTTTTGTSASTSSSTGGAGGMSTSSGTTSTTGTGTTTSSGTGAGGAGTVVTPGDPGPHDVLFAIDSTTGSHPISPYVYGTNQGNLMAEAKGLTMTRMGGNRLTAYNWETNASNAGSDYQYEDDDYMSSSMTSGLPMQQAVQAASSAGASIIMTVPIAGWVSANESGPCPSMPTQAQIAQNFFPILPQKGSAYVYPPNLTDGKVYADEFVHWLESQFPNAQTDPARRIFYMMDNEPDLWSSTHSEIHPAAVTYAELVQKNTQFATGVKSVAPDALVFGPVDYGWEGYITLQNAPNAAGRDWLDFYLTSMSTAEQTAGKRLLDVLDVHWYPEATGGGTRITDDGTGAAEVEARLQAPRSLWDMTYTETSWITADSTNGPIYLIPRLLAKIQANYPGTKLSISEYNYGAGGDISGGLAEADVLGVFGAQGLFAAAMWALDATSPYIFGGFALYRNYDGQGATFGDTSISLANSDTVDTSAYASLFAASSTNVIVVAVNKETTAVSAGITIKHTAALGAADVYVLTSAGASPQKGSGLTAVATNAFLYNMPPRSATTLVFHP
jgi:Glycoside hydrolase family 44